MNIDFLKIVVVKYSFGIHFRAVLQTDGRAAFVIEIYKEVVRVFHNLFAILSLSHPCLGDDLGAVQRVLLGLEDSGCS